MRVFWLDRTEARRRLQKAAVRLVRDRTEVAAAYLFGSLAAGRAVPGSDADILLVLDDSNERWMDRPLRYAAWFERVGLPVELFCYTVSELTRIPLARRAIETGTRLAGSEVAESMPPDTR